MRAAVNRVIQAIEGRDPEIPFFAGSSVNLILTAARVIAITASLRQPRRAGVNGCEAERRAAIGAGEEKPIEQREAIELARVEPGRR